MKTDQSKYGHPYKIMKRLCSKQNIIPNELYSLLSVSKSDNRALTYNNIILFRDYLEGHNYSKDPFFYNEKYLYLRYEGTFHSEFVNLIEEYQKKIGKEILKDEDYRILNVEKKEKSFFHQNEANSGKDKNSIPLNQILYGPPGTGKTYNTIYKALDILEPLGDNKLWSDDNTEGGRAKALDKFNVLKGEGRIVMTTFHQSMSYEDFVEGIKPVTKSKDGKSLDRMIYESIDGILKKACRPCASDIVKAFKEWLYKEKHCTIPSVGGRQKYDTTLNENGTINISYENNGEFKEDTVFDNYILQFLIGAELNPKLSQTRSIAKFVKEWSDNDNVKISQTKSTVLIIDEINRGNVANIFGELITLIEDDKRTTKWDGEKYVKNPEGVKVKLPYSGQEFGVPGNLYIIGTMNTADRSVEALDSALRRRFSFTEMMPKPKLLKDVKINGVHISNGTDQASLADLLYTINKRIEILKDREHQIGHSYFMKFVNKGNVDAEELREVFYNKIIPLLQEYFYGDYESILKVLSSDFIKKEETKGSDDKIIDFFANIGNNDGIDKPTDLPYTINIIEKGKFAEAIESLELVKFPIDKQEVGSTQLPTEQSNAQ